MGRGPKHVAFGGGVSAGTGKANWPVKTVRSFVHEDGTHGVMISNRTLSHVVLVVKIGAQVVVSGTFRLDYEDEKRMFQNLTNECLWQFDIMGFLEVQ